MSALVRDSVAHTSNALPSCGIQRRYIVTADDAALGQRRQHLSHVAVEGEHRFMKRGPVNACLTH